MVGGFLTRFAAVAAANPRAASSSISRVASAAAAAAPSEPPLPGRAVIQIEYCESCGFDPWLERFRSVVAEMSTSSSSASASSSASPLSSSSSSPSAPNPTTSSITVVSKKVRAVGAFEISLLRSSSSSKGGSSSSASSSSSSSSSPSFASSELFFASSSEPLWSKLSTGQPSSVEGVAAVARLAVQEAARAAAREEEREGAEAAKGRGGGASVGGVKRKMAIFFSDSDFVSLMLLTRSQGSVNHAHIQKKQKNNALIKN